MGKQSSKNKLGITEEFIFDQNKLSKIRIITLIPDHAILSAKGEIKSKTFGPRL